MKMGSNKIGVEVEDTNTNETKTNDKEISKQGFWRSVTAIISSGNVYPLLPLFSGIIPHIFLLTSYLLGIYGDHNIDRLPYPSDLGNYQPERGFFTLSLSLWSCLLFSCVFVRYLQLNSIILPEYRKINYYCAYSGMFAVVGQCMVFSFSFMEDPVAHYMGAFFFFILNTSYMFVQARMASRLPQYHPKILVVTRFVCSLIAAFSLLLFFFGRILGPPEKKRHYLPQVSEWILGADLTVFFLTYIYDFNGLWCESNNQFYEVPDYNKKAEEIVSELRRRIEEREQQKTKLINVE